MTGVKVSSESYRCYHVDGRTPYWNRTAPSVQLSGFDIVEMAWNLLQLAALNASLRSGVLSLPLPLLVNRNPL